MIYVTERLGRMGSLYSVSKLRGSIYVIVQPDFLYALYILINGRLEASGIESVLVCFPSLPTTLLSFSCVLLFVVNIILLIFTN